MSGDLVPIERVKAIVRRGVCWSGCKDFKCDAVRLAREVLERREKEGTS